MCMLVYLLCWTQSRLTSFNSRPCHPGPSQRSIAQSIPVVAWHGKGEHVPQSYAPENFNTRSQICPLYMFGNYPPQMKPTSMDLNIGETRVWLWFRAINLPPCNTLVHGNISHLIFKSSFCIANFFIEFLLRKSLFCQKRWTLGGGASIIDS